MRLVASHAHFVCRYALPPVRVAHCDRLDGLPDRGSREFKRAVRCGQKRESRALVVEFAEVARDQPPFDRAT